MNTIIKYNKQPIAAIMSGKSDPNKWKSECWDIKSKNGLVYHKDKTLANCWEKYGVVKTNDNYKSRDTHYLLYDHIGNGTTHAPTIVDMADYIDTDTHQLSIIGPVNNPELFSKFKEYYATNPLYRYTNYMFGTLWNTAGNIHETSWKFTIDTSRHLPDTGYVNKHALEVMYMFKGTNVEHVHFHFKHGALRSLDGMFQDCHNLKSIRVTYDPALPSDISTPDSNQIYHGLKPVSVARLFRSSGITSDVFPKDLDYAHCREFSSFVNGATSLTKVPPAVGCTAFEEHNSNIIIPNNGPWNTTSSTQPHWAWDKSFNVPEAFYGSALEMFSWTPNLVEVGPVINFMYIKADWQINSCFHSPKLERIRIKNITNVDWDFADGSKCYLPKLDKASIDYLFNNARDLAHLYQEGNVHSTFITRNSSTIKCPESWRDKITQDMINSMKNKGWTVYIGGQLANPT